MKSPLKMARTAQIIDTIGVHSNMESNNDATALALANAGWRAHIVSNYVDATYTNPERFVLPMFYRGRVWRSVFALAVGAWKFRDYVRRQDNDTTYWLLHNYGMRLIDGVFLLALGSARVRTVLIVHDVLSIRGDENALERSLKIWLYRRLVRRVVVHSRDASKHLQRMGCRALQFETELFRTPGGAAFADPNALPQGVSSDDKRLRILMFGSIRRTKGLDTALQAMRLLPPEKRARIVMVIAGRDSEHLLRTPEYALPDVENFITLDRFISEAERSALFSWADVVLLPYREVYQSGVLELAVSFRRTLLTSSIRPFADFLTRYPSFGQTYGTDAAELSAALLRVLEEHGLGYKSRYHAEDVSNYSNQDPSLSFSAGIERLISAAPEQTSAPPRG